MTTSIDKFLIGFDRALRALASTSVETSTMRFDVQKEVSPLTTEQRRHSAGLMRVNHVGEVCAQALYQAQALATKNQRLKKHFEEAAREEGQHLAWTAQRLKELESHRSFLNPLWYLGAFGMGWLAGKTSDTVSLSFVAETEKQVEAHLNSHLVDLPEQDVVSRAIVDQMRLDEIRHGAAAWAQGAQALPWPIQKAMTAASKVMTRIAYWI